MDRDKIFRIITGVIFVLFISAIVISNNRAKKDGASEEIMPVIEASTEPLKVKPEDEGGIDIPFRGTEIYSSIEDGKKTVEEVRNAVENTVENTVKEGEASLDSLVSNLSKEQKELVENFKQDVKRKKNPFDRYRSQLGSFHIERDAQTAWKILQKRYPEKLGNKELYIEIAKTEKGTFYRVQTELITYEEAEIICKAIDPCLIVDKR